MLLDRKPRALRGVVLLAGADRGAAGKHSPVVQDARNVANLRGPDALDEAQCEVGILRALEPLPEPANLTHDVRAVYAEGRDQIVREEQGVGPVALDWR